MAVTNMYFTAANPIDVGDQLGSIHPRTGTQQLHVLGDPPQEVPGSPLIDHRASLS